jgi:hypothetical protein
MTSNLDGAHLKSKKFRNIHKLFYSIRGDNNDNKKVVTEKDVQPENFVPMFLYEIDEMSSLFNSEHFNSDSDEDSSSSGEVPDGKTSEASDSDLQNIINEGDKGEFQIKASTLSDHDKNESNKTGTLDMTGDPHTTNQKKGR